LSKKVKFYGRSGATGIKFDDFFATKRYFLASNEEMLNDFITNFRQQSTHVNGGNAAGVTTDVLFLPPLRGYNR
jgi:hypothetical protein